MKINEPQSEVTNTVVYRIFQQILKISCEALRVIILEEFQIFQSREDAVFQSVKGNFSLGWMDVEHSSSPKYIFD